MLDTAFCTLLSRLFPYKCQKKGEKKLFFNDKVEIASVEY